MRKILPWSIVCVLICGAPSFADQAAPAKSAPSKTASAPVNLNTASESDLEALPGIGPATAKKIIAGRPYATVADLAKAGVPKSTIEKITPLVTAGGAAKTTPPAPAPGAPTTTVSSATAPAAAASNAARSAASSVAAQQPPVKGMVWVNLSTKVYHMEGDKYYGNTKNGKFMTEEDAIKAGYHKAKK